VSGGGKVDKIKEYFYIWLFGGITYGLIEILWRGHTHYSMVITGGICFLVIYRLSELERNIVVKSIMGALAITAIELTVGVVVNIIFGLGVWDYSEVPLNLLGQICPIYTLLWFLLCIPGMHMCREIRKKLTGVYT
jgi:uncharacterized membrane protein